MDYYAAFKREILALVTTGMNPEDARLTETNQAEKDKDLGSSRSGGSEALKCAGAESRTVDAGGGGGEQGATGSCTGGVSPEGGAEPGAAGGHRAKCWKLAPGTSQVLPSHM